MQPHLASADILPHIVLYSFLTIFYFDAKVGAILFIVSNKCINGHKVRSHATTFPQCADINSKNSFDTMGFLPLKLVYTFVAYDFSIYF